MIFLMYAFGSATLAVIAAFFHFAAILPYFSRIHKTPKMPAESEGGASLTVVASPISFPHKPFTVSIDGNDLMETCHGKSMTAAVAQGLHKVKIVNETRESELAADMQGDETICVSMSERKIFAANSPSEYFRREEELRALHRTAFIRANGIMGLADAVFVVPAAFLLFMGGAI